MAGCGWGAIDCARGISNDYAFMAKGVDMVVEKIAICCGHVKRPRQKHIFPVMSVVLRQARENTISNTTLALDVPYSEC